jgi:hypothetical protein
VAAWTSVVASSFAVPPEEFARVEAIRRGEAVERRAWEAEAESKAGGIDFIELAMDGGAVAAGRSVAGHESFSLMSVGYWPSLAQRWIAPAPEGPTYEESWFIAALAFVLSLAFWLPWMLLWTWIGARTPTTAAARRATS